MPNRHSGLSPTTESEHTESSPSDSPVLPSLKQTAQELAIGHRQLSRTSAPAYLLHRLAQQAVLLEAAYQAFAHPAQTELVYSAAAEWVLDNYYVIDQTLQQIKEDLPPNYYQELPRLGGDLLYQGYPQIGRASCRERV